MKSLKDMSLKQISEMPDNELRDIANNHGLLELIHFTTNTKLNKCLDADCRLNRERFELIIGKLRRMKASPVFDKRCN